MVGVIIKSITNSDGARFAGAGKSIKLLFLSILSCLTAGDILVCLSSRMAMFIFNLTLRWRRQEIPRNVGKLLCVRFREGLLIKGLCVDMELKTIRRRKDAQWNKIRVDKASNFVIIEWGKCVKSR